MNANACLQAGLYFVVLLALAWPLGLYMARVFEGRLPIFVRWLAPLERGLYRLAGTEPDDDMSWRRYALAVLLFNAAGFLAVYALQRLQLWLPLNPQGFTNIPPDLAFNTAVSFATNTNWQSYSGEVVLSYFTQMFALTVQNFVSAATGIAVLLALVRGFTRREAGGLGNFWVDMTRATLYVLLPLSLILAVVLVGQGVVQTFSPYKDVARVETLAYDAPVLDAAGNPVLDKQGKPVTQPASTATQTLALGPAASQIAIKQLGTNGGGFFGVNSAHPYENPTPLANFLEMLAILLIPAALCVTFGRMVRDDRQGFAILAAMTLVLGVLMVVCIGAEQAGNPMFDKAGLATQASDLQAGGNMEGKDTRFGIVNSAIWATATTAASNGSVNAMHDSFTPLGGLVPMWLMQLGEVIFGGAGSGLYGMLVFALVAVFVAGLMIGRTPEYLGKKIESFEMKMSSVALLAPPAVVLVGTAVAVLVDPGRSVVGNPGTHGFSEILYAFSSAANNNGSAFGGLGTNNLFYNLMLGFAMLIARYWVIVPVLAIAGSLAAKKSVPASSGTLPTHGPMFVGLLIATVVVVGALSFLPALALGPIAEHLQMIVQSETSMNEMLSMFDRKLVLEAALESFKRLGPRHQLRNPVMFVVWLGSLLTTGLFIQALRGSGEAPAGFIFAVTLWLWFTVLFANFAEAIAEGRGKAQAAALRGLRKTVWAKKLVEPKLGSLSRPVPSEELRCGDIVMVAAGETIPGDGVVIEGIASVDESAITGESAPVIREAGGDFSSATGGTRVLSDWLMIRIAANPGETFLDRMISMVEGAQRKKTPNEIALTILLVFFTLIFLLAVATLLPFSVFSVVASGAGKVVTVTALTALLVCLIPTTIGGLLSAIGVAGMGRMMAKKVIATSGRAVEAAGDVDVLLLDKTGTITLGNRQASTLIAAQGVADKQLAEAALMSSLADETPEGRSIVVLAKEKLHLRGRDISAEGASFVHFSAHTRMSGIDFDGRSIRKGAAEAVRTYIESLGGCMPREVTMAVEDVSRRGSTPLVVAEGARVLGIVELKDIVKGGIKERFAELRQMGIRTVMITGDNRLTAAAIAAEAGVDDFLAEATPEAKLKLIREYQKEGRLVAMTGDGTNDAPALAQADVAVAMNSGTQAAKEAGNMVDLDSNPTKLIEIVETGKQMLMTRGSLTTFSIANDVAKYFAIIPAMFVATYPQLGALNVMHLATPNSAILSAVIFNALIIIALIPLALKGVAYRPLGAAALLRRNLLVYGCGGLILPFIGIKAIDLILVGLNLA